MGFTKRNILKIYLFTLLTFGIYGLYWFIQTKKELNDNYKEDIPTCWLLIIPIANIIWLYRYTEVFIKRVKKSDDVVLWFILFWLASIITPYIVQTELNKLADNPSLIETVKQYNTGRICTNCGRPIPFDAQVCPYCGKKFIDYL